MPSMENVGSKARSRGAADNGRIIPALLQPNASRGSANGDPIVHIHLRGNKDLVHKCLHVYITSWLDHFRRLVWVGGVADDIHSVL